MKLDHSFINIRKRSLLEIFDLSMLVIRRYPLPLLGYLVLGALPWFLLNEWILWETGYIPVGFGQLSVDGVVLWLLVIIESGLGTVFVTAFLGLAMFDARPTFRQVTQAVLSQWLGLFWVHGILRGVLPLVLIVWMMMVQLPDDPSGAILLLVFVMLGVISIKAFRPYITEILVLERPSFSSKNAQSITVGRRSGSLHGNISGDSFSLAIISAFATLLLIQVVYSSIATMMDMVGLMDEDLLMLIHVAWPVSLWLVAGVMTIVRFLAYIDTRIRQEGWEVELKIRAEAIRLQNETKLA
jgi:hypothetical protein